MIKAGVGPAAQSRHGAKALLNRVIATFLKHEQRQAVQAAVASLVAEYIDGFFNRIAYENQCTYSTFLMLPQAVIEQSFDLGKATFAANAAHLRKQCRFIQQPLTGAQLPITAVVAQLYGESAKFARREEHLSLQFASAVPSGLSAGSGVHSKQQTRALIILRRQILGLGDELVDLTRAGAKGGTARAVS